MLSFQVGRYGPMLGVYETACDMLLNMSEAGGKCLLPFMLCVQEGDGPMLGVYETACDMLLDMSEACRAMAAEKPDGGGGAGDAAEAVTLEHWRRARSNFQTRGKASGFQECMRSACIAWHAKRVAETHHRCRAPRHPGALLGKVLFCRFACRAAALCAQLPPCLSSSPLFHCPGIALCARREVGL